MNAQTKVSAKGQVVIPKDVRRRYQMAPGLVLDVVETPEGVLLKLPKKREGISVDEAIKRLKKIVKYDGPPVTIEDMNESIKQMWAQGGPKGW